MPNKLYRHIKTGNLYEVISTNAKIEATWEDAVVYRQYGVPNGPLITRSMAEFFDGRFEEWGNAITFNEPFDPMRDMAEFHEHFGLEYRGRPRALPADLSDFRNGFLDEELGEYKGHQAAAYDETTRAPTTRDQANYTHHLEHALDGLVDLVYVALGTAYLHGFDFRTAWQRVHRANMQKVRKARATGATHDSGRAGAFDVVKPEGWEPPTHKDLVEVNDCLDDHHDRA